ncbi:MAG: hypothetical protein ACI9WU_003953 [Myxococcota bacterium]|jgi:hypothetical protein
MRPHGFLAFLACTALLVPSAGAVDVHVSSRTVGQGYQLITSGGDVLKRSRLNQFLGLDVLDLKGDNTNSMSFVSSFRFDGDFGMTDAELEAIAQLQNNQLSIMYAYFDMRDLGGSIDLRLGRQLLIDEMDFTMLDGLRFKYHTPWFFGVEVVGGIEVKNAGFLDVVSSTQLELDGSGGNDDAIDEDVGIVVGGALFLRGLRDHHGKVGYRRVMADSGDVDAEKVYGNYHVRAVDWLHLHVGWAYDFLISDLSDLRTSVRFAGLADVLDVELSYLRLLPSFEGSSIFNIFNTEALNDVDLRLRARVARGVSAYVGGYVRLFGNDKDANDDPGVEEDIKDFGAKVGGRVKIGRFAHLGLDAVYQVGYGDYSVVDLYGGYGFLDGDLNLTGRLTTVLFEDIALERLEATSFGGNLGLSYQIERIARFHLVGELNSNKIESVQFRMFGLVDLDFWL